MDILLERHKFTLSKATWEEKSDMQIYHNQTKAGVDVVDEMCKAYSTRTKVQRWPVVHLQNMLDVTAINVFTIFNLSHPRWSTVADCKRRRHFIQHLATELAKEQMMLRLQDSIGLLSETVVLMSKATGQRSPRQAVAPILG